MSAKNVIHISGPDALLRRHLIGDVAPLLGRGRAGMYEQHIVLLHRQRHGFQEGALPFAKLVPGPCDRGLRVGVHAAGGAADRRRIVVAEHHHCAIGRVPRDQVEHGHGIPPIADQVAEECVPIRPQRSRMGKAGANCLQVAVNVSK